MKAAVCIYKNGKYFPHVHIGQDAPKPQSEWEKKNPHTPTRCENGLDRLNEIIINFCGRSGTHEKVAKIICEALKAAPDMEVE